MRLDDADFQKAAKIMRDARDKMQEASDEMIKALELKYQVSSETSKDLLQQRANRYLQYYESWRQAEEVAQRVAQDIANKLSGL